MPLYEFLRGYPETYITTVYFDTRDRDLYRRAERSYDNNMKVRVKEYYYRDRNGENLTFPTCFVELKERRDGVVYKRRFRTPKEYLHRLFQGEDIWSAIKEVNMVEPVLLPNGNARHGNAPHMPSRAHFDAGRLGTEAQDVAHSAYEEFHDLLKRFSVAPTSVVNYRRMVYQVTENELRITFDDEITLYPAPSGLYRSVSALTREVLGKPTHLAGKVILEIKCASEEYPEWLRRTLRNHSPTPVSKFTTSVRYLTQGRFPRDDH